MQCIHKIIILQALCSLIYTFSSTHLRPHPVASDSMKEPNFVEVTGNCVGRRAAANTGVERPAVNVLSDEQLFTERLI
jgi:hypothetical protein